MTSLQPLIFQIVFVLYIFIYFTYGKEKVKLSHLMPATNTGNYKSTGLIPGKVKISD
jgi:hypothetical protein